ncbi:hypothetical protein ACFOPQ_15740 [Deinococcus antarcticus]|jgi:hypothetical protein|uniref:Uncharacterized protein n=1 Tax=Deinococcus antarcticus TaxID=1298767 RepID=A0ABV8AAE6_9DEIO
MNDQTLPDFSDIEFHSEFDIASTANTTAITVGQPPVTVAPPLPKGFVLLSRLLQDIPITERSKIIDEFNVGIESGTVVAVRRQGGLIPVQLIANTGRKRVRKIADWMIMDTPRFRDWIKKQRAESHYAYLMARGEITITETEAMEDVSHFERLAKMQRELLKKQRETGTRQRKTTAASSEKSAAAE